MTRPTFSILALAMAAGLTVAANGSAFAETDLPGTITVVASRYPMALERRVDEALAGSPATLDQKIEIVGILEMALHDVQPLRDQRAKADTALREAMSAATVDAALIERLRRQQMDAIDAQSKRLTQTMKDVGKTLDPIQRLAFFKNWSERPFSRRAEAPHASAKPS